MLTLALASLIAGCSTSTALPESSSGDTSDTVFLLDTDMARDDPDPAYEEKLSSGDTSTLITQALADVKAKLYGYNCKTYIQHLFSSALGITIPSTSTDQITWASSTHATSIAKNLATYANKRVDATSIAKSSSSTYSFSIPNTDPQEILCYGSSKVSVTVTEGASSLSLTCSDSGALSSSKALGKGTASLKITNSDSSAHTVTVVVFSKSRFDSDWNTAYQGTVLQMCGCPYTTSSCTTGYSGCTYGTPHTALVNSGPTDWIDSNWTAAYTVGEHTVSEDTMIKMVYRYSCGGFSVYEITK